MSSEIMSQSIGDFLSQEAIFELVKQNIQERRSIRKYTEESVTIEDIQDILDCARYAPSDTNSQTWFFHVIINRDKIKEIEKMTWDAIYEKAKEAEAKGLEKAGKLLVKSFGSYATSFSDAPVLIVCTATPYESKFKDKIFDPIQLASDDIWIEEGIKSSSLAIQNLMLTAHAKGLGTCAMTGPVLLAKDQLREYLSIGDTEEINMVIALGHPSEAPKKLNRKDVKDIMRIID